MLEKTEAYIFGLQPSVIFSELFANKVFSELMYFSYFSFYLLIICFTLAVFFKSKDKFIEGVFRLSASLYIFYIIFVIFPSAGPQFYFSFPDNTLPDAYVFNNIMLLIQELAEQPTGAFPSSHVGVSVIVLMLSRKILPVFYKLALIVVFLLILSTVYIKAHYLVDVIGGIIIAPFILKISDLLYTLLPENIIASKTNTIK